MTDQLTGLPAADWYTDPSDPASERWWGGLEWTNHTRPLDVAPPAPPTPQFALPAAAAPPVAAPVAVQPVAVQPVAVQPAAQPVEVQPVAVQPVAVQPAAAAPLFALPAAAAPAVPAAPIATAAPAAPAAPDRATTSSAALLALHATVPESPAQATVTSMFPVVTAAPAPATEFAALLAAAAPSMFETQHAPASAPSMFEIEPAAPTFSPSQFASAEEASGVASWVGGLDASTGSPWETRTPAPTPAPSAAFSFGTPPAAIAAPATAPVPVATRTHHVKKQSNTPAVVGFILSLLGLGLVALIVSARGAKKANHYASLGEAATGRTFARWGIAISTITTVVGVIVGGLLAYSLYFAGSIGFLDDLLSNAGVSTSGITTVSDTTSSDQVAADAVPTADRIASSMAGSMQFFYGTDAQSVLCPADAAYTPGSVVSCDIVLLDGTQLTGVQTFTDHGWSTEYIAK